MDQDGSGKGLALTGRMLDVGCVEVYQDPADLLMRFEESLLGK
jgi:hypothetical protein